MKLDVLVISAHPDDLELSCSGTVASLVSKGRKVGAVDITRGELGTRGTEEIRAAEAEEATRILGITVRENAGLPDGFFMNNKESQIAIARFVRKYQPEIVISNAIEDRHPDHGRAARLTSDACFIAGLARVPIPDRNASLAPWRPKAVYHYIQSNYIVPDLIVDISGFWEIKLASMRAFKSQFYDPESDEPETYISSPHFLKFIEARCRQWGHAIGAEYGEGFTVERHIGVRDLFDLI